MGPRHSYQQRQSLTARVDETEENLVINGRWPAGDEHAVLLDQACRPAGGHNLDTGTVRRDIHLRAGEQA